MKWLSPKTVAGLLDINRTTAMRMMKDGRLPGFELMPGMWRVSEEALTRFVRKRERKAHLAEALNGTELNGQGAGHWPDTPVTN